MSDSSARHTLEELGLGEFQKRQISSPDFRGLVPARVIYAQGTLCLVRSGEGVRRADVCGRLRYGASGRDELPAAGDWVMLELSSPGLAVIRHILERRNMLARNSAGSQQPIAANIDAVLIVQSAGRDYSLNRFERYMALAYSREIESYAVLNKTDLLSSGELMSLTGEIKRRFPLLRLYAVSASTGEGISKLEDDLKAGCTYCFLGSSGVGKTSIISVLAGDGSLRTGRISDSTNRGRHITTSRELYIARNGAIIIDNPGMREVGVVDSSRGLDEVFTEIRALSVKCRFSDCSHMHEPGCAVREAVKRGALDSGKYGNYVKLVKEDQHNSMDKAQRRRKDREFGRHIKRFKDDRNKREEF